MTGKTIPLVLAGAIVAASAGAIVGANTSSKAADMAQPAAKAATSAAGTQKFEEVALAASELKGRDVYSDAGKKVGEVADVIPASGTARQIILAVGGFLGIGEKLVSVPASTVNKNTDGRLVVAMSEAQLKKLPDYKPAKAPKPTMPAK
jgi:sporulation protein YlmC with PRC-barrel domain